MCDREENVRRKGKIERFGLKGRIPEKKRNILKGRWNLDKEVRFFWVGRGNDTTLLESKDITSKQSKSTERKDSIISETVFFIIILLKQNP